MTCRGCQHQVVLQREGVLQIFRAKGWNPSVEVAGEHFRCRHCGHRGATIRPVAFSEHRPLEPPRVLWER